MTKRITIASLKALLYHRAMSDDDNDLSGDAYDDSEARETAQIVTQLSVLRSQHRHLDTEVNALQQMGVSDMLMLGRMKKRKLQLKDQIRALEDKLTPDIIA